MFLLQDSSPAGKEKTIGNRRRRGGSLTAKRWPLEEDRLRQRRKIEVVEDRLVINIGNRMSERFGIAKSRFPGQLSKIARGPRDEGSDFFCGMTFSVEMSSPV